MAQDYSQNNIKCKKKNRIQNELIPNSLSFVNIQNVCVSEYVDMHRETSEGDITKMLTVVTLVVGLELWVFLTCS